MLAALDVHPRVAMQILLHSKSAITLEIYTEVPSAATRAALKKLSGYRRDCSGLSGRRDLRGCR